MSEPEKNTVVVPEEQEEQKSQIELEGLSEEEVQMAKDQGVIKEDKPGENPSDKEEPPEKPEGKSLQEDDYDTFDKVHDLYEHDKEKFYSLPRSVKNQYHNAKGLYKRVKDEEERRKKLEDEGGYNKLQDSIAKARIDRIGKRIAEAKADPENKGLTVEELETIIDLQEKADDESRPMTVKDYETLQKKKDEDANRKAGEEQARQQKVNARVREAEIYAKSRISEMTGGKYDKFDDVVTLAYDIIKMKPRFGKDIAEVLNGDDSIEDVVDTVISIAKINPKWGTPVSTGKQVDIERIEKNAQRAKTSANLTAGKGGKVVSFDDLTPEDAVKLTRDQWEKLPRKVRHKLLLEVS